MRTKEGGRLDGILGPGGRSDKLRGASSLAVACVRQITKLLRGSSITVVAVDSLSQKFDRCLVVQPIARLFYFFYMDDKIKIIIYRKVKVFEPKSGDVSKSASELNPFISDQFRRSSASPHSRLERKQIDLWLCEQTKYQTYTPAARNHFSRASSKIFFRHFPKTFRTGVCFLQEGDSPGHQAMEITTPSGHFRNGDPEKPLVLVNEPRSGCAAAKTIRHFLLSFCVMICCFCAIVCCFYVWCVDCLLRCVVFLL